MEDVWPSVGIVEESCVGWWTVAKLHSIFVLESFTEDVSAGVPKSLSAFAILKFEQFEIAATLQRAVHVPEEPLVLFVNSFFCFWVQKAFIKSCHT